MLKDKNIVIIGGTSGIGLSAGAAFIQKGANVVATGIDEASCNRAKELFQDRGITLCLDARIEGTAKKAIEKCVAEFGSFDALFHVAGGAAANGGMAPCISLAWKVGKRRWTST